MHRAELVLVCVYSWAGLRIKRKKWVVKKVNRISLTIFWSAKMNFLFLPKCYKKVF